MHRTSAEAFKREWFKDNAFFVHVLLLIRKDEYKLVFYQEKVKPLLPANKSQQGMIWLPFLLYFCLFFLKKGIMSNQSVTS